MSDAAQHDATTSLPRPLWGATANGHPPLLARAGGAAGNAVKAQLAELRRFHHGGPTPGATASLPDGVLPALLAPFRARDAAANDLTLVLAPGGDGGATRVVPLADLLALPPEASPALAPEVAACLARRVAGALAQQPGAVALEPLLRSELDAAAEELQLAAHARGATIEWLAAFLAETPAARLLGLPGAPLHLLDAVARPRVEARRARFRERITALHRRLEALLRAEGGDDTRQPDGLGRALGAAAGRLVDTGALARVAGRQRGTAPLSAERRVRIEQALGVMAEYVDGAPPPVLTILRDKSLGEGPAPEGADIELHDDACAAAAARFDREAEHLASVLRAARTARLEVDGAYDPARHDAWLAALGWEAFSRDELLLVPVVVAQPDAERLEQGELASLTRLLLSGRPVQILVEVDPARGPAAAAAADGHADYRLELGALGVAHRHAVVHQTTAAQPAHLVAALGRGLDATCAALTLTAPGPALRALAAVEARAHPLLAYDPDAGSSLARRLRLDGNPQPESTWPVYPLVCRREDGAEETRLLPFTFADFALLEPALHAHFRAVPASVADEHLVALGDHLEHEGEDTAGRLPFVLAVAPDGRLLRLVVSRALALECDDRASTWTTLQEQAGVRSDTVSDAVHATRMELLDSSRNALLSQQEQHRAEVETARMQAVGGAMRTLAESLLADDPAEFARRLAGGGPAMPTSAAVPAAPPPAPPAAAEPPQPTPAAAAPAPPSETPWVESPLCTSCDDCVRISSLLFVYDENKQIRIGDPTKGTFAQLVKAAEKCPARCIHPGQPLNPNEPGLEGLKKRAAAFA